MSNRRNLDDHAELLGDMPMQTTAEYYSTRRGNVTSIVPRAKWSAKFATRTSLLQIANAILDGLLFYDQQIRKKYSDDAESLANALAVLSPTRYRDFVESVAGMTAPKGNAEGDKTLRALIRDARLIVKGSG